MNGCVDSWAFSLFFGGCRSDKDGQCVNIDTAHKNETCSDHRKKSPALTEDDLDCSILHTIHLIHHDELGQSLDYSFVGFVSNADIDCTQWIANSD